MSALRVGYLGHSAQPSGSELGLVELLAELRNGELERIDPYVILAEDGPLVDRLRARSIPVEILPLPPRTRRFRRAEFRLLSPGLAAAALGIGAHAPKLGRRLRRLRLDLVHANTIKSLLYGAPAARVAGLPLIWHVHDRIAADYLPRPAVWAVRAVGRRASAVIANSETTVASIGPLSPPATVVAPAIALTPRARPAGGHRPFAAAIVGRLAPWKGQHIFLRAFASAFPEGDERAVVVGAALFGEDDYVRDLHLLVDCLDLGDRVEFRGFREDVGAELARVDALVHASVLPEPFGRVVVEGMAAGLPVVAAAPGGPAEVLTEGVDGLLYPIGDIASLSQALTRLAGDEELRAALGQAGALRARQYRPEVAAAGVLSVYRSVLDRRRCA